MHAFAGGFGVESEVGEGLARRVEWGSRIVDS